MTAHLDGRFLVSHHQAVLTKKLMHIAVAVLAGGYYPLVDAGHIIAGQGAVLAAA